MSFELQALAGPALGFAACAALASYAQNLTGFAFSLILLGLSSVLHIAAIDDAANAATVLSLVNAWTYLRGHPGSNPWHLLRPILNGSVVGMLGGLFSSPGPPLVSHLYRQALVGGLLCVAGGTLLFSTAPGRRFAPPDHATPNPFRPCPPRPPAGCT